MIRIERLSKRWPGFALRGIDLTIGEGEYFVLLGPTGSGKTLLLECVAGHHRLDAGRVRLCGRDVTDLPPERRGVGFLYQDCWLFPHLTVAENIRFGLRFSGASASEQAERVRELAGWLGITHLLPRSPVNLSGGERRKAALARALAPRPKVMLLDEPLGTLDRRTRFEVAEEIRSLHERTRMTTLHVTHDQEIARLLADRIGVIRDGAVVQTGRPGEVFSRPASDFVARFVSAANCFEATAEPTPGGRARAAALGLEFDAEEPGPCMVFIPPDAATVRRAEAALPGGMVLRGVVQTVARREGRVEVDVDAAGARLRAVMDERAFLAEGVNVADAVVVSFDPKQVRVFPREVRSSSPDARDAAAADD